MYKICQRTLLFDFLILSRTHIENIFFVKQLISISGLCSDAFSFKSVNDVVIQSVNDVLIQKCQRCLEPWQLVLRQISDPRRYLPSHTIKMAISSMALYDTFNTESSSKIRKPAEYNSALRLNYNGENLVQLLSNLKTSDLWTYQEIEKQLFTVNQGFQSFEFSPFGSQLYMSIREVNMSHTIGMQHISDGTLRYTILMSILLNKQRGALIGLDEPEGRLHPDMINSIAEMLRRASLDSHLLLLLIPLSCSMHSHWKMS